MSEVKEIKEPIVLRFTGEEMDNLLGKVQSGDQTASRAISDGEGNIIPTTYATKNEKQSLKEYADAQIQEIILGEF